MSQPEQSESIFYHVPVELIDELKKYRTRNSKFVLRYRYRDPVPGIHYGTYGGVPRKHAQTASIYVRGVSLDTDFQKQCVEYCLTINEKNGEIQALLVAHEGLEAKNEQLAKRGDLYYKRWIRLSRWWPVRIARKFYWLFTGKEYGHEN